MWIGGSDHDLPLDGGITDTFVVMTTAGVLIPPATWLELADPTWYDTLPTCAVIRIEVTCGCDESALAKPSAFPETSTEAGGVCGNKRVSDSIADGELDICAVFPTKSEMDGEACWDAWFTVNFIVPSLSPCEGVIEASLAERLPEIEINLT